VCKGREAAACAALFRSRRITLRYPAARRTERGRATRGWAVVSAGRVPCRERSAASVAPAPLLARLAPDVDRIGFERRRQPSGSAIGGAEAAGHADRAAIGRIDAVDDLVPAEMVERP